MTSCGSLYKRIGHAPVRGHLPRHNCIVRTLHTVVVVIVWSHVKEFRELRSRRLNLAEFVCTAGHNHALLSVPLPVHAKPRVRHSMSIPSNFSLFPGVATVRGYFDLTNNASAGPGEAGDLVDATAGQLLSAGRERDH